MEFRNKNCKVLVVTDLASRGIDLPHVTNVIHFDFPAQVIIIINYHNIFFNIFF